jgi:outer membrane protein insertion porin family
MAPGRRWRRSIAAGALFVVAFGPLSLPTEAVAQARDIIEVQGNRRVDADTVRSYFHATPDGRYDDAARDAAFKALLATGLFDKVTIDRIGERLVVHLTEAPVLDHVAFEGNKKIQDKELAAVVESKPRGTLQRAVVQADVGRIMESYRHAGRDDVSASTSSMWSRRAGRRRCGRSTSWAIRLLASGSLPP